MWVFPPSILNEQRNGIVVNLRFENGAQKQLIKLLCVLMLCQSIAFFTDQSRQCSLAVHPGKVACAIAVDW